MGVMETINENIRNARDCALQDVEVLRVELGVADEALEALRQIKRAADTVIQSHLDAIVDQNSATQDNGQTH